MSKVNDGVIGPGAETIVSGPKGSIQLNKDDSMVVGTDLGGKYKIARVPYLVVEDSEILTTRNKAEALEHAMFISHCFCNPDKVQY